MTSENEVMWSPLFDEQSPRKSFLFSWQKPEEREETLEEFTAKLLENGKSYLKHVVGDDYPFAANIDVTFTGRKIHGARGATMNISTKHLRETMNGDPERIDLEQSLIIHELVHGLVDTEELPMMIELAYMIEKGLIQQRLKTLEKIFREGRLLKKYEDGLRNVANALEMQTLEELFSSTLNSASADILKAKFSREIRAQFPQKAERND